MDDYDTSYDVRHMYLIGQPYPTFTLLLTVPEISLPSRRFTGFGQVIRTQLSYN
jgi:hypothetical protein